MSEWSRWVDETVVYSFRPEGSNCEARVIARFDNGVLRSVTWRVFHDGGTFTLEGLTSDKNIDTAKQEALEAIPRLLKERDDHYAIIEARYGRR